MIAGMDDLPKELLDEILPYLTVDELFVIAQLSRRLNILALQLFFPYHSIQNPSALFKARIQCGIASHLILPTPEELALRRNGALSGLAIAIGIKQIDEFRCRFFLCATCPLASKFRNYRHLIHVFKRLEKVRNISIVFDYPNRFGVGFVPVSVEKQRREIVTELLNLCVEKGCEKLSIQNGCFYPPSLDPAVPPPKATLSLNMGSLFGSFRGLLPSGHSPKSQGRAFALPLFESARLQTQLTQLEVSSLMMLTPPCWRWTHSILETPSLTSLTLFQIQLPSEVWQTIFGWLIIPIQSKLLDLSVVKCTGLPTQEFISFLLDLKALTYIKLVTPLPPLHRFRLPWTTKTILPALMGITAPPEWIVLLCPSSIPRPTLRYVNIAPGSLFGFSSCIEELNPILKNPVFRDRTVSTSEGLVNSEPDAPIPQIVIDFSIFPYSTGSFKREVQRFRELSHQESCLAYNRITHLTIHAVDVSDLLQPEEDSCIVTEFLGYWKSLWCVEFVGEYMPWEGRWTHQWNDEVIERLLRNAKVWCPGVQIFVIQKKIYQVYN